MTILCVDGYNILHRARSGFQLGDYNVIYNFFRGFKALVEQMKPTRVYFTLEGKPKRALQLLSTYKANRIIDTSTEEGEKKHKSLEDFHRQKDLIVGLLTEFMPVSVVVHPDFEADDVIYNLVKNASRSEEWTVVSSDSDFIQLLNMFPNVKLYNPITKLYVEAPEYDYVTWKALRGDGSDNIPGIKGISDKVAEELCDDVEGMLKLFENKEKAAQFERNSEIIKFADWTDEEMKLMRSSSPTKNWDAVKAAFEGWEFKSLTKETYWVKFQSAFDPLWG